MSSQGGITPMLVPDEPVPLMDCQKKLLAEMAEQFRLPAHLFEPDGANYASALAQTKERP